MRTADEQTYKALGGEAALEWAESMLGTAPDAAPTAGTGEILVLGLPYGGPNGGKDSEGQFFSESTDFMDDVIEAPPVMYTHGTQNGFEPEPVGVVNDRWYDDRGGWFKVRLDADNPRYNQLLESHASGNLRASTGAVPASYSVNAGTGHIETWLVGELSLVDLRDGYRPINAYAITKGCEKCEEALFHDYYGESVSMDIIAAIKEHLGAVLALVNHAHEEAQEDIAVAEDHVVPDTGFIDPYYKADRDFGGRKRSELDSSDFIFPDEKAFPVVTCDDAADAVRTWGLYKGKHSFEEFKRRLTARMNKLDCPIPDSWQKAEEGDMPDTEKCESCDEAKRLADELKAELATPIEKCARCPEAVGWVRTMVKAGRMSAVEAFKHLDAFVTSDETFDAIKAEVESRTIVPAKAEVFIAGGSAATGDVIDQEHMNRQRRLVGLPVKEIS